MLLFRIASGIAVFLETLLPKKVFRTISFRFHILGKYFLISETFQKPPCGDHRFMIFPIIKGRNSKGIVIHRDVAF